MTRYPEEAISWTVLSRRPTVSDSISTMRVSARVLAIDPGERWVGFAISDAARRLALPLATIDRRVESDEGVARIRQLLYPDGASLALIGVPLGPDGGEDAQATRFRRYGERLAAALQLPAVTVSERYSNAVDDLVVDARSGASAAKLRPRDHRRRRRARHAAAAAVILQRWLDRQSHDPAAVSAHHPARTEH